MVFVEVRSPFFNEEEGRVNWRPLALVRADGDQLTVQGNDTGVVDLAMPVLDVTSGQKLHASDSPEAWARNLPYAYRAGDLVAVVLHDSQPLDVDDPPVDRRELPSIPAPQHSAVADDATPVT